LDERQIRNELDSGILVLLSLHVSLHLRESKHAVLMLDKLRVCCGNAAGFSLLKIRGGFKEEEVSNSWGISANELLVSKVVIDFGIDFYTLLSNILMGGARFKYEAKECHELLVQDALHSVADCLILRSFANHFRSSFQGNELVHGDTFSDSGLAVDDVRQVEKS